MRRGPTLARDERRPALRDPDGSIRTESRRCPRRLRRRVPRRPRARPRARRRRWPRSDDRGTGRDRGGEQDLGGEPVGVLTVLAPGPAAPPSAPLRRMRRSASPGCDSGASSDVATSAAAYLAIAVANSSFVASNSRLRSVRSSATVLVAIAGILHSSDYSTRKNRGARDGIPPSRPGDRPRRLADTHQGFVVHPPDIGAGIEQDPGRLTTVAVDRPVQRRRRVSGDIDEIRLQRQQRAHRDGVTRVERLPAAAPRRLFHRRRPHNERLVERIHRLTIGLLAPSSAAQRIGILHRRLKRDFEVERAALILFAAPADVQPDNGFVRIVDRRDPGLRPFARLLETARANLA